MALDDATRDRIQSIIDSDPVVLFMKGQRSMPQCGFSARVIQILDSLLPEYTTCDVLSDSDVRDGIKAFSAWPTIPQLYVKGQFVGGCDIVNEMYESGELRQLIGS
jgi:monothiol glutaredoxin